MKKLKKLLRVEMKTISGGEPGKWACCRTDGGGCSSAVYGDSDNLTCVDKGTVLVKSTVGFSQSLD